MLDPTISRKLNDAIERELQSGESVSFYVQRSMNANRCTSGGEIRPIASAMYSNVESCSLLACRTGEFASLHFVELRHCVEHEVR